ncbi:MAG: helix-turn-helix domain-containing protein [Eubacterium sp.]
MNFCEKLNEYINELGCTAKDLADTSGLSQAVISRYKNGRRTPVGDNIDSLAKGIAELASQKNIPLTEEQVLFELEQSLNYKEIDSDVLIKNLNNIMSLLDINANEIAKASNYDPSYLSRIRSGQRKPANPDEFAKKVSSYIVNRYYKAENIQIINDLVGVGDDPKLLIEKWLCSYENQMPNRDSVVNFLTKMDNFNLDEYIEAIHFNDIKVPTVPINISTSKSYYGIKGMRKGELDFLRAAILSKSKEDIFMHSEMPMADMAEDISFNKRWMMSIAMLLKKGVHLNIIHNLDRPWNELMLGLEAWIPIYMTGQVSPYYIKRKEKGIFRHINYTSGTAALSGECVEDKHGDGKYYVTKIKHEVEHYQKQADNILKKATPLMEIYTQSREKEFYAFFEKELEGKDKADFVQNDAVNTFKNIEVFVNSGKWAIISKAKAPRIHFVIRHPKLVSAIEDFKPAVTD